MVVKESNLSDHLESNGTDAGSNGHTGAGDDVAMLLQPLLEQEAQLE